MVCVPCKGTSPAPISFCHDSRGWWGTSGNYAAVRYGVQQVTVFKRANATYDSVIQRLAQISLGPVWPTDHR